MKTPWWHLDYMTQFHLWADRQNIINQSENVTSKIELLSIKQFNLSFYLFCLYVYVSCSLDSSFIEQFPLRKAMQIGFKWFLVSLQNSKFLTDIKHHTSVKFDKVYRRHKFRRTNHRFELNETAYKVQWK